MSAIKNHFHDAIEESAHNAEGMYRCERCNGTGAIDAAWSGSDPCCPECDGTGYAYDSRKETRPHD